jgi:hypothetical protein
MIFKLQSEAFLSLKSFTTQYLKKHPYIDNCAEPVEQAANDTFIEYDYQPDYSGLRRTMGRGRVPQGM